MTLSIYLAEIKARIEKAPAGPWRAYPNPMRSDGLFVAQDKPIEPYEGTKDIYGNPQYPAVPRDAWGLGMQVEHGAANFIAHSRTDIEKLVKIVEVMREGLEVDTLAAVDKILEEK